jgi:hypothetical protein
MDASAMIRGRNLQIVRSTDQKAQLWFVFFDENQNIIGDNFVGPFDGTFDWNRVTNRLSVPTKTSMCTVHIGLMDSIGEFSIDSIAIRPLPRQPGGVLAELRTHPHE